MLDDEARCEASVAIRFGGDKCKGYATERRVPRLTGKPLTGLARQDF
jgi:hypothetical protein